jgi:hypothetical protein
MFININRTTFSRSSEWRAQDETLAHEPNEAVGQARQNGASASPEKEIVMFRFAVALVAVTLISASVLAQQPAPNAPATAPAATHNTKPAAAKPTKGHAHHPARPSKGKAKVASKSGKPAADKTTGAEQ